MNGYIQLPIHPPVRGSDAQGAGHYGAPRGSRAHNGIDLACYPGSTICAVREGMVTKIGYPYDPVKHPEKGHLRYVQVTDSANNALRYFYVQPIVKVGDMIEPGQPIGVSQRLSGIYPGITDHIHFEVKINGRHIDPTNILTGGRYG